MIKDKMNKGIIVMIIIESMVLMVITGCQTTEEDREYSECVKRQCAMCLFNDSECYENECNIEELGCYTRDGKPDIYMEK